MEPQNVTDTPTESSSMDSEDIAHLAGVFDAVGNISIRVIKDSDYRLDYTLQPLLRILRPDEDDPVLGKLLAYCDEQGVRYSVVEKTHGVDQKGASIEWTVNNPESVQRFLEPMMNHLVTNFFDAQLMMAEALPALSEDKHLEKDGFIELMGLADELRKNSQRRNQVKYTQEYFEDEWSI